MKRPILSALGGFLVGVLLTLVVTQRYQFCALGAGKTVAAYRFDRWTGRACIQGTLDAVQYDWGGLTFHEIKGP